MPWHHLDSAFAGFGQSCCSGRRIPHLHITNNMYRSPLFNRKREVLSSGLYCKKKADLPEWGTRKRKRCSHGGATPLEIASFSGADHSAVRALYHEKSYPWVCFRVSFQHFFRMGALSPPVFPPFPANQQPAECGKHGSDFP